MSPVCFDRRTGMPLLCKRKRRPDCVPSGTLTRVLPPSMIGAVALEERMRSEREENIEIAGRPAAHARFPFTGEANARAVLDTGRNVDRERALARDPAGAGAGG